MATIKSHTTLEQARVLQKMLPLESADMQWFLEEDYGIVQIKEDLQDWGEDCAIPCWSLAALRSLLPSSIEFNGEIYLFDSYNNSDKIWVYQYAALNESTLFYYKSIREVDACYEMIICLHEQKHL